jgi:hypothetical protein
MKTSIPAVLITFPLVLFTLAQDIQAVDPPPDGGYPRGNTAEGNNALFSLSSGAFNTAIGDRALFKNTRGNDNTATGAGALENNVFGSRNVAVGARALASNASPLAASNTAIGVEALQNNNGFFNTATGATTLQNNTEGKGNTATGGEALMQNTEGDRNTATGGSTLKNNTEGNFNTANGYMALFNNTEGNFNVALGVEAGSGVITADDVICIGHSVAGVDVSGTCFIGNIRGVTTQNANAVPVLIDGSGQLGTASSSRRYKTEIKPMDKTSESILALKPVSFRYKVHKDTTAQFGLIAEEVAKVNPDLVIYDSDGEPYTVRYDAVNAMLFNEFLKEHHQVQDLKAIVAQQQKQIEGLTTGLQKVSDQLELSKSGAQTVNNNQ